MIKVEKISQLIIYICEEYNTMAIKDSEEATLHCSIRGYHMAIWSAAMENWTCSSTNALESSYDAGGQSTSSTIESTIATL